MEDSGSRSLEIAEATPLESFDFNKLVFVFRKSIIWFLLIFFICLSSGYLSVRYTKPVFESSSLIQLDFKSEANNLGLVNRDVMKDLDGISGEMELLKSRLFLTEVATAVNYNVSYHFYGRYLTDERYKTSPFEVSYKVKNPVFYNRPIDVVIMDKNRFELLEAENSFGVFQFGQDIETPEFNLLIEKTNFFQEDSKGRYFFKMNDIEALVNYFQTNVSVEPENLRAKTIKIKLKDFNPSKARDFLMAIDTLYLEFTKRAKNQTLDQKINFIDDQIASTENRLSEFEIYFEDFTIDNKTVSLENDIAETIMQLEQLDTQQFNLE